MRCGPRHLWPRGRFLRNRHNVGEVPVDLLVQRPQEPYRLEIFVAAVMVGDPFPVLLAVVAVEHRGHGIHSNAVHVVLLAPENGTRHQKVRDFGPTVVEDQRVPVRMASALGIHVLVEVCPVKPRQAVRVIWKVGRSPVDDHADATLVQRVDQGHEFAGIPEAAGRGEIPCGLIAPRAAERVFRYGQQLHMSEAHLLNVVG